MIYLIMGIVPMTRTKNTCLALLTLLAYGNNAVAGLIVYDDRALFEADNTGLATEDFENANLLSGEAFGFAGPLNSLTDNSIFAAGSVIDGFSLVPDFGEVYVGKDFGGVPTVGVSSNSFGADINLLFDPDVTAVGLDLFGFANNLVVTWTVTFNDNVTIGSTIVTTPGFFGVSTSSGMISSLFLNKPDSGGVIDNLIFGTPSVVPEPGTLALLGIGLFGMGLARRRKQI